MKQLVPLFCVLTEENTVLEINFHMQLLTTANAHLSPELIPKCHFYTETSQYFIEQQSLLSAFLQLVVFHYFVYIYVHERCYDMLQTHSNFGKDVTGLCMCETC